MSLKLEFYTDFSGLILNIFPMDFIYTRENMLAGKEETV